MNLTKLREEVIQTINNIKDHGVFPKENNHYDFKLELNFFGLTDSTEIFLRNFAKDIISFTNTNGGIILLGFNEDKSTGNIEDIGLNTKNIDLLKKIDLNDIAQKFEKITKVTINLDLQSFQSGTRKYYYLLIEKQSQVILPLNDYPDYKFKKGDIIYRLSSKNKIANETPQDFNSFLQLKANEKSKEFMEIWSKLLPEMFEINPREVLIINPKYNKVYGYNGKENILSSSEIEIEKGGNGVFNVILNAISAGDIGKISDTEGKPLYKIVGEIKSSVPRDSITISTLQSESLKQSNYKFTNAQLKLIIKHLGWVDDEKFKIENPDSESVNPNFCEFLWIETVDSIKDTHKVVFSKEAVNQIVNTVNNQTLHKSIFKKDLEKNTKKK
ncbi:ATP-binding protein [Flavobacterium sp.]|uniref:ATP-binding protein n=1 Tax=Flavobacterium sp. TaxID=239 RepID=UPI0025C1F6D6|nr:ATP-binding protein [Flavobacterium sp.]MBA4275986.1 ATP-binding protein [Flavobacterium sp.]